MTHALTFKKNLTSVGFGVLIAGVVASYIIFSSYKPVTVFDSTTLVKGISSPIMESEVPLYPGAENLSSDQRSGTQQSTQVSSDTSVKIYAYYKDLLQSKGWKLTRDLKFSENYSTKFEKGKYDMLVSIARDRSTDKSIISINYSKD